MSRERQYFIIILENLEVDIDANYKLTKRGLIRRVGYKDGRTGWTKFSIEKSIKEQIHKTRMVSERSVIGKQTVSKPSSERSAERSAEASSCINSFYNSEETDLKTPHTTTRGPRRKDAKI